MTLAVEGINGGGTNNVAVSWNINITTAGPDRVVIVEITMCNNTATTVTSVTASGLTFALRKRNVVAEGGGPVQTLEVWWAYAAAQLTAKVISVNYDQSDSLALLTFAVSGCPFPSAPWDTNGSLPASATNIGAGAVPTVAGVSTDSTKHLLLEFINTRQGTPPTVGAGFTTIGPMDQERPFGNNRSYEVGGYKVNTVATSATSVVGGNSLTPWGIVADAIKGDVPIAKPQPGLIITQ